MPSSKTRETLRIMGVWPADEIDLLKRLDRLSTIPFEPVPSVPGNEHYGKSVLEHLVRPLLIAQVASGEIHRLTELADSSSFARYLSASHTTCTKWAGGSGTRWLSTE